MDKQPLIYVIFSATLFGISTPLAKVLVTNVPPITLAGLLYLGAFVALSLYSFGRVLMKGGLTQMAAPIEMKDLPWLSGAVLSGGVVGPISLMMGLRFISGFTASLLLNLEGLATGLIAYFFFKENAGRNIWLALSSMTIGGVFLSWDPQRETFNLTGPLLIFLAMVAWGLDNNLTNQISGKNPVQIAWIKGGVAGTISLSLALFLGRQVPLTLSLLYALALGSFSYGVSLVLYIKALKGLGSFRTGEFFSLAPFIGALTSIIVLREWIGWVMFPATACMVFGVWFIATEQHQHLHVHNAVTHSHVHTHDDLHHPHDHPEHIEGKHSHEHVHQTQKHSHTHWPDLHHRHEH